MSGPRQAWLVARRELHERIRSRAFLASLVIMVLVVASVLALPALLGNGGGTKDVGLAGTVPDELPAAIRAQGDAVGTTIRIRRYATVPAGEQAVRDGHVDVLVVDGRQLDWRRRTDQQLQAVVTGAIQLVAVQQRATAAGISPDQLSALLEPVPVSNIELGRVAGRSADDETAALILTLVLFGSITTYGAMVLSGVVEEKSSRVVEVLLARMPARNLLAGKIAGIGLLGLAQVAATALVALVTVAAVDSIDLPAVRGSVLAWAVVWFVLGYALYATVFGALGSLASRTEDASSVSGPVTAVLIAAYFVSFAAVGSPDTAWALAVSLFPATAPLAMPTRIAMGAATWWEPVVAVALTLATIAGLVQLGGRIYTRAILHTGPTLKLREAWRGTTEPATAATPSTTATAKARVRTASSTATSERRTTVALVVVGVTLGIAVAAVLHDVAIGLAVAAGVFVVASRIAKARTGGRSHAHR